MKEEITRVLRSGALGGRERRPFTTLILLREFIIYACLNTKDIIHDTFAVWISQ